MNASNLVQTFLKDPVCNMTVTAQSSHVLQYAGKPVYFCSAGCKAKFLANPANYLVAALESKAEISKTHEPSAQGQAMMSTATALIKP